MDGASFGFPALPWPLVALAVWALGAWLVLSLLVLGILRVQWLSWQLPLFGGRCAALVRSVADELGVGEVEVLRGPATAMPMTWGVRRPTILLPSAAVQWPIERLDAVIRHELAHIRRRDTLTQLIADLACAVYWFNPLVWLAAHRLRIEREHACDDEVLAAGSRASEYAAQLLDLTRSLRAARATSLTAIAMARPAQLRGRLTAVLDEDRSRRRPSRRAVVRGWVLALLVLLPFAGLGLTPATSFADQSERPVRVYAARAGEVAVFPSGTMVVPEIVAVGRSGVAVMIPPVPDTRWVPLTRGVSVLEPYTLGSPVRLEPPSPARPWVGRSLPVRAFTTHAQGCWDATSLRGGLSIRHDDDLREISWRSGSCRAEVRLEGEVEFTDDFRGIARLSRGGELRIREDDGRTERVVEVRPDGDGVSYRYSVDGRDRTFDAAARAWFDNMLLQLFRTGFAAEERVAWMLRTQGLDAVIQEIGQLRSSYPMRIYYEVALAHPDVTSAQAAMLVRQAGQQITSDYELAELLIATADDRPFDDGIRDAFIAASGSLESDYEHRRVLALVLTRADLSAANVAAILESTASIGSDYEKAELLVSLSKRYIDSPDLRAAYLRTAVDIGSDFEKRRVVSAVLADGGLNAAAVSTLLEVAESIGSDYERAELLVDVAANDLSEVPLQRAYVTAVEGIGSDFEHRRALSALISKQTLDADVVAQTLATVEAIGSDYEKAEVLLEIARTQPVEGEARALFLRALDTIRSTHEHGRVSSALLRAQSR
jgi:hypothetical protein